MAPVVSGYTSASPVYTKGSAVSTNKCTADGRDVLSCPARRSSEPGLSLSSSNGRVTGTPSVVKAGMNYVVTATNSGGSDTFTLSITVNDGELRRCCRLL